MSLIRPLEKADIPALKKFSDREIGNEYFSTEEYEDFFRRSFVGDRMCSLVLEIDDDIAGVRITLPPGQWSHGKGKQLSPEGWPHPLEESAYFQTIAVASDQSGKGYGRQMSLQSIEILKELGVSGIVCHSWKESPNNSSQRYLLKLGFQEVAEYPEYWKDVEYDCIVCQKRPCLCTAQEMYLDLKA